MSEPFSISGKFILNSSVSEVYSKAIEWVTENSHDKNESWLRPINYVIEFEEENKLIVFKVRNFNKWRWGHVRYNAKMYFSLDRNYTVVEIDIPKPYPDTIGYPSYLHSYMYEIVSGIFGHITPEYLKQVYPKASLKKIININYLSTLLSSVLLLFPIISGIFLINGGNFWAGFWIDFVFIPIWLFILYSSFSSFNKYRRILEELY